MPPENAAGASNAGEVNEVKQTQKVVIGIVVVEDSSKANVIKVQLGSSPAAAVEGAAP